MGRSSETSASLEIILDFLVLLFITNIFLLTCSAHFLGHCLIQVCKKKCQNSEFFVLELNFIALEKSYLKTSISSIKWLNIYLMPSEN